MHKKIPILFEDNWFLIVEKPPGLVVTFEPQARSRSLTEIVNNELRPQNALYKLYPCHRIDRETSGIVIFSKGKSAQKKVMELFKKHRVKKTYLACVQGNIIPKAGVIKKQIEHKQAITLYRVKQQRKDYALVEVRPITGRTNQIRLHFKAINHPLVGESKFTFRRDFKLRARRLLLHARRIEFVHPFTGEKIIVESTLPYDMQNFLEKHN
ncbi:MAG: RluA family pseudouridine synthase [Candidatus Omnitrophica bacterium]|nr:RluA family pseudouridine synthase [Candidatus Omnitrophota bacterium]